MAKKIDGLDAILASMGATKNVVSAMPKVTRTKDSKYKNLLVALNGKLPLYKDAQGNAQGLPLAFDTEPLCKAFYGSLRNHLSRRGVLGYVVSRDIENNTVYLAIKTQGVVYTETK